MHWEQHSLVLPEGSFIKLSFWIGSVFISSVVKLSFAGAASLAGFSESTSTTRFVSKISLFDVGLEARCFKAMVSSFPWYRMCAYCGFASIKCALHL